MVYIMNEFFSSDDLSEILSSLSLQTERHKGLIKKCLNFCLLTDKREIVDEYQDFYDMDIKDNKIIDLRESWL